MFCSQCGAVINQDAQFCSSCGAATPSRLEPVSAPVAEGSRLQPGVASHVPLTNPTVFAVQQPPAKKKRRGKLIAIIGAAVVVLIIIIAVAGSGGNNNSPSGGKPSGVNTQSSSYRDGYSDGHISVYPGSAISVQSQCEDLYMTAHGDNETEYVAGCVAGGSNNGNG